MESDEVARVMAKDALDRIERHEADCVEFRKEIREALGRLFSRWWYVAVGVIGMLLSACGWLLTELLHR